VAYFLAITVGMILCLAMLGGGFVYFLSSSLNRNDSTKVDALESERDN